MKNKKRFTGIEHSESDGQRVLFALKSRKQSNFTSIILRLMSMEFNDGALKFRGYSTHGSVGLSHSVN